MTALLTSIYDAGPASNAITGTHRAEPTIKKAPGSADTSRVDVTVVYAPTAKNGSLAVTEVREAVFVP